EEQVAFAFPGQQVAPHQGQQREQPEQDIAGVELLEARQGDGRLEGVSKMDVHGCLTIASGRTCTSVVRRAPNLPPRAQAAWQTGTVRGAIRCQASLDSWSAR